MAATINIEGQDLTYEQFKKKYGGPFSDARNQDAFNMKLSEQQGNAIQTRTDRPGYPAAAPANSTNLRDQWTKGVKAPSSAAPTSFEQAIGNLSGGQFGGISSQDKDRIRDYIIGQGMIASDPVLGLIRGKAPALAQGLDPSKYTNVDPTYVNSNRIGAAGSSVDTANALALLLGTTQGTDPRVQDEQQNRAETRGSVLGLAEQLAGIGTTGQSIVDQQAQIAREQLQNSIASQLASRAGGYDPGAEYQAMRAMSEGEASLGAQTALNRSLERQQALQGAAGLFGQQQAADLAAQQAEQQRVTQQRSALEAVGQLGLGQQGAYQQGMQIEGSLQQQQAQRQAQADALTQALLGMATTGQVSAMGNYMSGPVTPPKSNEMPWELAAGMGGLSSLLGLFGGR